MLTGRVEIRVYIILLLINLSMDKVLKKRPKRVPGSIYRWFRVGARFGDNFMTRGLAMMAI